MKASNQPSVLPGTLSQASLALICPRSLPRYVHGRQHYGMKIKCWRLLLALSYLIKHAQMLCGRFGLHNAALRSCRSLLGEWREFGFTQETKTAGEILPCVANPTEYATLMSTIVGDMMKLETLDGVLMSTEGMQHGCAGVFNLVGLGNDDA